MAAAMRGAAMKPAMKKVAMKAAMKSPVMKAAMKAAMKAKSMKTKVVSKIAKGKRAKALVFKGGKEKTASGLTKANLLKNKRGKVVSKGASVRGKKNFASSPLKKWSEATKQARKDLKITGFCAVGGSSAQGKALLAKVRSILGKK